MKIITNEKLIRRNSRLGQITSMGGLLVLAGGMYVSFRYPEQVGVAWIALFAGFALSQVGLYYGNRWGRRPRPDEHISQALKSMDDRYTLYNYCTPVSNLLLGPAGLWVLMPHHQTGKIVYEKGRWRQKGGGILQAYLRLFAQEGIGRPDLEVPAEFDALQRFLKKRLAEEDMPELHAALVFTSDKAEIEAEDAPIPTVPAAKLKELLRKNVKENGFTPDKIKLIQDALGVDIPAQEAK